MMMLTRGYLLIAIVTGLTVAFSGCALSFKGEQLPKDPEHISNGSFEIIGSNDFPSGFFRVGNSSGSYGDDSAARTGEYSLYMAGDPEARNGLSMGSNRPLLISGETYHFSVWYRASKVLAGDKRNNIHARLQLTIEDGTHPDWEKEWIEQPPADAMYQISTLTGNPSHLLYIRPHPDLRQDPNDSTDWDQFAVTFTVPTDMSAELVINLYNDKADGPVWFDDLSLLIVEN